MSSCQHILLVVEGAEREIEYFSNLSRVCLESQGGALVLPVPADMNVYMLWSKMKDDSFETDIVEVLRENVPKAREALKGYTRDSFSEVYLFFDFDEHTNNIPKGADNLSVLAEMLEQFDNETELGKLYISYPMIEALRDFSPGACKTSSGICFVNREGFLDYKELSASQSAQVQVGKYTFLDWEHSIENYVYRLCCLLRWSVIDRDRYIAECAPSSLFAVERTLYANNKGIFVLSAAPAFLLDYSLKFWTAAISNRKRPPAILKGCKQRHCLYQK